MNPATPTVIYDGDCTFCRKWVDRWRARTGNRVAYEPFQKPGVLETHRVSRKSAERAVLFVGSNGQRSSGAVAVAQILALVPALRLFRTLIRIPPIRFGANLVYGFIARHRGAAAWVDWLLFGNSISLPKRRLTRALYMRALGACYLAAFASLRVQVLGLYGKRGILPIRDYLNEIRGIPELGKKRYSLIPSLFWLKSSDRALVNACRAGQLCSVLLILGIAPRTTSASLWAIYLSFVSTGRDFLSFQWDALLLEAGFDSIVIAPSSRLKNPPWLATQLMRLLFSRLYFESGLCKRQSGDPNWRSCTACRYHYETQPLPAPLGWYAHQLPKSVQKISTRVALHSELLLPLFCYAPRRIRHLATAGLAALQGLIAATGNYGFFNLLTLALSLWGADDPLLANFLPRKIRENLLSARVAPDSSLAKSLVSVASAALFILSTDQLSRRFPKTRSVVNRFDTHGRLNKIREWASAFYLSNSYGLFSVMTTTRPEVIIEGSTDGKTWLPYEFRYKPGNPKASPRFVAPHQPRLDWQMWFAAMQRPPEWFLSFVERLLEGSPEVLPLLGTNPFPIAPPKYIRASYYDYRMASLQERRKTGVYWKTRRLGLYLPVCQLSSSKAA